MRIEPPSKEILQKAFKHLDNLTKPRKSLGYLEEIAARIAAIKGSLKPRIEKKYIITFAADHGVAEEGVSLFPKEVTAQMVHNFLRGGAGVNVLAEHVGAEVMVVDIGVDADFEPHPSLFLEKVGYGTRNMRKEPAMTKEEAHSCIEAGRKVASHIIERGADIIGVGDMGIANTTASTCVLSVLLGEKPTLLTGAGTGLDEEGIKKKCAIIDEIIEKRGPKRSEPLDVLSKVGGFEIGGMAGAILECAEKKVPIVIDGFIATASFAIAYNLCEDVKEYVFASHCSGERGHKLALSLLGLRPILDLGMRLGEGTGAALAITIVEAACKIIRDMATFEEACVSRQNS
jgi:nicotinate-nucleotide--dimethylbenzimidazole phosphoribosyltransferase